MRTQIPVLTFLFLCFFFSSYSQEVSTIWNSSVERLTDALILDDEGNLYGADYNGQSVYVLSPSGEISTFASGMNTPNGIAFDSAGNLFVCDNVANRIYKLDPDGVFLDTISTFNPSGIIKALESDTMIFTSYQGSTLNKLAPDGAIIETHELDGLNGPVGLAYDDNGVLYVGNYTDREIYSVIGSSLNLIATVPGPTNGALGFIAYGGGMLWGTSLNGQEIYQIDPNFQDSTILYSGSTAGNMDGPISEATFSNPNGIITNANADSVYISQFPGGKIRLISPSVVGIKKFNTQEINIYPNPTEDILSIQTKADINRIEIMDVLGDNVLNVRPISGSTRNKVDVSSLQRGMLFVRIYGQNNEVIVKRFIKL